MEVIKARLPIKTSEHLVKIESFGDAGEVRIDYLSRLNEEDLENLSALCGLPSGGAIPDLVVALDEFFEDEIGSQKRFDDHPWIRDAMDKVIAESKSKSDSPEKVDNKVANRLAMNLAVLIRSQAELLKQAETDYQFDLIRATLEIGG